MQTLVHQQYVCQKNAARNPTYCLFSDFRGSLLAGGAGGGKWDVESSGSWKAQVNGTDNCSGLKIFKSYMSLEVA